MGISTILRLGTAGAVGTLPAMPGSLNSFMYLYPCSVHMHSKHVCIYCSQGPWNHADRIQKLEGVEFSAIVDPNTELAEVRVLGVGTMLLAHCRSLHAQGAHAQYLRCP